MQRTYGRMTYHFLESNRGFVVMRPFGYCTSILSVWWTAPNEDQTPSAFATHMSEAFRLGQHPAEQRHHVCDHTWAPPMALVLDMAEYLM